MVMPFVALGAGADQDADHGVIDADILRIRWKFLGAPAAFLALFAGTDQGAVCEDIGRQALNPRPPGGFGGPHCLYGPFHGH